MNVQTEDGSPKCARLGQVAIKSQACSPLGLSVVELTDVLVKDGEVQIHVRGLDLIDGTPIIDIKPYIPYSDCVVHAEYKIAQVEPNTIKVAFSPLSQSQISDIGATGDNLKQLIVEVLQQDPKPAYQKPTADRTYGVSLNKHNIQFRYLTDKIEVVEIAPANTVNSKGTKDN